MDPATFQQKIELLNKMKLELELKRKKLEKLNYKTPKSESGFQCPVSSITPGLVDSISTDDTTQTNSINLSRENRINHINTATSATLKKKLILGSNILSNKFSNDICPTNCRKSKTRMDIAKNSNGPPCIDVSNGYTVDESTNIERSNVTNIPKSQEKNISKPTRHSTRLKCRTGSNQSNKDTPTTLHKRKTKPNSSASKVSAMTGGLETLKERLKVNVDFGLPDDDPDYVELKSRKLNIQESYFPDDDVKDLVFHLPSKIIDIHCYSNEKTSNQDVSDSSCHGNGKISTNQRARDGSCHDNEKISTNQRARDSSGHDNEKISTNQRARDGSCHDNEQISTNQRARDSIGHDSRYILCTCEKNLVVFMESAEKWIKIINWELGFNENETPKQAFILNILPSTDDGKTIIIIALLSLGNENSFLGINAHNTGDDIDLYKFHEVQLLRFQNGKLNAKSCIFRFQAVPTIAAPLCVVSPQEICITTTTTNKSSTPLSRYDEGQTTIKYIRICSQSLMATGCNDLEMVDCDILYLLPVLRSKSVCGISQTNIFLWHYNSGYLLQKFDLKNFIPCCDFVHNSDGVLLMVGRREGEEHDIQVHLNPMTALVTFFSPSQYHPFEDFNKMRSTWLMRSSSKQSGTIFTSKTYERSTLVRAPDKGSHYHPTTPSPCHQLEQL